MEEDDFIGCNDRVTLTEEGEDVEDIDFIARIFTTDASESEAAIPSYDQPEGFRVEGQGDINEIIDSTVNPISSEWDAGETYVLDGLDLGSDLYVAGHGENLPECTSGLPSGLSLSRNITTSR